jgi:ankyrin repeat protein
MSDEIQLWLAANSYTLDDLNKQGHFGNTALMKAAREGNAHITKKLLDAGADVTCKNVDGNTALWLACFGENPEVVALLLDAGIEVDTLNVNGVTSLMYAASSAKETMVQMLVDAGADVTIQSPDDFSALDLAVTPKILKILKRARG